MAGVAVPGIRYLGADLPPEVVAQAAAHNSEREFLQLDLTTSPLPPADMLLCRDCLAHLSFADLERALSKAGCSPTRALDSGGSPNAAVLRILSGVAPADLQRP